MWWLGGMIPDSVTGEELKLFFKVFVSMKEGVLFVERDLIELNPGAKIINVDDMFDDETGELVGIRYDLIIPSSCEEWPENDRFHLLLVKFADEEKENDDMDKNMSLDLDLYTNNAVDTNETYANEAYNMSLNENQDYEFKYISGFEDGEEAGKRDAMALFKTVAGIDSEEVSTIDALNGAIGIFSLIQAEMEEAPDKDMDLAYELLRNIVDIFDAADTANADLGNRAKCLAFVEGLINFMVMTRDATEELEKQKKQEGNDEQGGEA